MKKIFSIDNIVNSDVRNHITNEIKSGIFNEVVLMKTSIEDCDFLTGIMTEVYTRKSIESDGHSLEDRRFDRFLVHKENLFRAECTDSRVINIQVNALNGIQKDKERWVDFAKYYYNGKLLEVMISWISPTFHDDAGLNVGNLKTYYKITNQKGYTPPTYINKETLDLYTIRTESCWEAEIQGILNGYLKSFVTSGKDSLVISRKDSLIFLTENHFSREYLEDHSSPLLVNEFTQALVLRPMGLEIYWLKDTWVKQTSKDNIINKWLDQWWDHRELYPDFDFYHHVFLKGVKPLIDLYKENIPNPTTDLEKWMGTLLKVLLDTSSEKDITDLLKYSNPKVLKGLIQKDGLINEDYYILGKTLPNHLNHIDYRVKPESAPFITDKVIYTLMGKGGTDYRRPSLVTPDNEVQLRDIVDENTPLKQEYFQNHKLITFMPPYSSRSLDLTSVDWKKMKQQDFPVTVKALEEGKFYLKDDGAWYLDSMFNN